MHNPILVFAATSLLLASLAATRAEGISPESLCTPDVKLGDYHFDISSLKDQEQKVQHEVDTPPTKEQHEYTFNLCQKIAMISGVPEAEQCKDGTFFCERVMIKTANGTSIVSRVYQAAGTYDDPLGFFALPIKDSNNGEKASSLVVTFTNQKYTADVTLMCAEQDGAPVYVSDSYNSTNGDEVHSVKITWQTKAGCGQQKNINENPPPEGRSSGWSFFFILFVIIALYFGLGALYNSRRYNARGWDLIPHADFWRDLPYLIKDLVMAVYNSFRFRRQGGYVSV